MNNKKRVRKNTGITLLYRSIPPNPRIIKRRRIFCGLLILLWCLLVGAIVVGYFQFVLFYGSLGLRPKPTIGFGGLLLFYLILKTSKLMWGGGLDWIMQNGVVAFLKKAFSFIAIILLCFAIIFALTWLLACWL
jgi:hypothetical protein